MDVTLCVILKALIAFPLLKDWGGGYDNWVFISHLSAISLRRCLSWQFSDQEPGCKGKSSVAETFCTVVIHSHWLIITHMDCYQTGIIYSTDSRRLRRSGLFLASFTDDTKFSEEGWVHGWVFWVCSAPRTTALSVIISEQGVSRIQVYSCLNHVQPHEKGPLQKEWHQFFLNSLSVLLTWLNRELTG